MQPRPATPRIPPLPESEWGEREREAFSRWGASRVNTTLSRYFELRNAMRVLGDQLRDGLLPARDRELAIMRAALNLGSPYEWGQHAKLARKVGISDEEIARVAAGPDAPGWDEWDAALIRAADELHADSCISDATWETLSSRYDERQLIELPMLLGSYAMLGWVLNSLGVEPEDAAEPYPVTVTPPRTA